MRKGLVVILAVAMLIVSISSFNGSTLAAGAGTKSTAVTMTPNNTTPAVKPSALQPTTLTIATNNTAPVTNQSFTLSGMLTAGTTPLFGKTITLDRVDPSGTRTQVNTTTTTTTNGTYSFTRSESSQGTYSYYAVFAGDTLSEKLQDAFFKGLELADKVVVLRSDAELSVRFHNTPYIGTSHSVGEEAPQVCEQIGCPLCSIIACICTECADNPNMFEETRQQAASSRPTTSSAVAASGLSEDAPGCELRPSRRQSHDELVTQCPTSLS